MFSSNEMADMIFKCDSSIHSARSTKNLQMFNLLMALDGIRTVRDIAKQDGYDYDFLCEKINQLHEQQLVVALRGSKQAISNREMDSILSVLSTFVGPMAGALLEECAARMGHNVQNIPRAQTQLLIETLGEFIKPRKKAADFKEKLKIMLPANS